MTENAIETLLVLDLIDKEDLPGYEEHDQKSHCMLHSYSCAEEVISVAIRTLDTIALGWRQYLKVWAQKCTINELSNMREQAKLVGGLCLRSNVCLIACIRAALDVTIRSYTVHCDKCTDGESLHTKVCDILLHELTLS